MSSEEQEADPILPASAHHRHRTEHRQRRTARRFIDVEPQLDEIQLLEIDIEHRDRRRFKSVEELFWGNSPNRIFATDESNATAVFPCVRKTSFKIV
jgi:hypothetical protein